MPTKKRIDSDEYFNLKLTAGERTALVESRLPIRTDCFGKIRKSSAGKPIGLTLEELKDLEENIPLAVSQITDAKQRKQLVKVLEKTEALLETYDDQSLDETFRQFEEDRGRNIFDAMVDASQDGDPLPIPPIRTIVAQVRLSKADRKTLLEMDTIPADMHKLLAVDSEDEQTFDFNVRHMTILGLALANAFEAGVSGKQQRRLEAVAERLVGNTVESFEEPQVIGPTRISRAPQTAAGVGFRLKITLDRARPPIWRRVEVPDCSLDRLHEVVQFAMGWGDCHLHSFKINGEDYGPPDLDDAIDESTVTLSELFAEGQKKLRYWYDFGDSWWHTIKIEKRIKVEPDGEYPRCTAGARACPPEDVGGVWGYEDFLAALADPSNERHEEFREWCGEDFDPERFEIEKANARLQRCSV